MKKRWKMKPAKTTPSKRIEAGTEVTWRTQKGEIAYGIVAANHGRQRDALWLGDRLDIKVTHPRRKRYETFVTYDDIKPIG